MTKKKTAYLFALPAGAIPDDARPTDVKLTMPPFPFPEVLPFVIKRNYPKETILGSLPLLFDWYEDRLAKADDQEIVVASIALPALSLSQEYWDEAIAQLKAFLADYEVILGPSYNPVITGISKRYDVSDWYNGGFTGFPKYGAIVQYNLTVQKTEKKMEQVVDEEPEEIPEDEPDEDVITEE